MSSSKNIDARTEILYGNLWKVVPFIVFPVLTASFMETAWHFLNGYWVGKLGPVNFAAINVSSFFVWMFYSVMGIVNTGTTSLVAQNDGAGKRAAALNAAHQGMRGAVFLAVAYSLIMFLGCRHFFTWMGAKPAVIDEACRYTYWIFSFAVGFAVLESICAIMRGYGDTKTPVKALFFGLIFVFVLDPLLILGIGPFPRMGVAGGAVATNICFLAGLVYLSLSIYKRKHKFMLRKKFYKMDFAVLKEIIRIGLPPSANSILFSIVSIFLASMVAKFGTESMAALGIGHRIESISFLVCVSFSIGCVTLVGQNIGAKNPGRAQNAALVSMAYLLLISVSLSLLFYFGRFQLAHFFIADGLTATVTAKYLEIISFSQVFMAIGILLDGVFSGSGKTLVPMLITVPVVLARIPLAYYLAFSKNMGIEGIWWAITILTFVKAVIYLIWFFMGQWKKPKPA